MIGLSGGVDSAVAAYILIKDGFEVAGVFLSGGEPPGDAERVARELGIGFECADISLDLEEKVISPFVEAYLRGETPSPCILCNPAVKFRALLGAADRLGAEKIATGHYARASRGPDGRGLLFRGLPENDQSYMLHRLPSEVLARAVFPLGAQTKAMTRAMAEELSLSCAKKPDSMEICFIKDGGYREFIESRAAPPPPGHFVGTDGRVLGSHRGIHAYTVGQRRHLGLSGGDALYVGGINPARGEVTLVTDTELYKEQIRFHGTHMIVDRGSEFDADIKIRHSRAELRGRVTLLPDGGGIVRFCTPARAPAPGQSAVFYDGGLVLGGGFISGSES